MRALPAPAGTVFCANDWCRNLISEARAACAITQGLCPTCNEANTGAWKRQHEPDRAERSNVDPDGWVARVRP